MINEHDLKDWDRLDPAPLYTVKPKSYIDIGGITLFFDHLDGMFSYCLDLDNNVVHLSASALVTPLAKP